MIDLRPITTEDVTEIRNWPSYSDEFAQMDYALRERGWLDEYMTRPKTRIYIADSNKQIIGFSLLSITAEGEAEFRIAIHPRWIGKGVGREFTLATLEAGFQQLNLDQIYLIVRKNNPRAAKLYESIGFVATGESVHAIQGVSVEFSDMVMTKEKFNNPRADEGFDESCVGASGYTARLFSERKDGGCRDA